MTTPGPGWHRDPEGAPLLRYWDGQQWTSATQPIPAATPTQLPPETPEAIQKRKRNNLIAAGIVGVAVVGFGTLALVDKSDNTETAAAETTTSEAATTTAPTDFVADKKAARAACDQAIIDKWNPTIDPSIFAFQVSQAGDDVTVTGAIDTSSGTDKVRYEFAMCQVK